MHPVQSPEQRVVESLGLKGMTLSIAESLTAGLACARLADVPGASAVLHGGVVAYDAEVKVRVLGVDACEVARTTVSSAVARAMAEGVRALLNTDIGLATTGVAGPQEHGGQPVGSVWIAVAIEGHTVDRHLSLEGSREQIREASVQACWSLLLSLPEISLV